MSNVTVIMTEDDRATLRRIVREQGEMRAATLLGVNNATLVRAAGGFGVQRTTAAALRLALLELPKVIA